MTLDQSLGPSFALLRDLAQHDSDASAKALAALLRRYDGARDQLRMLEGCRTDYRARLDRATRGGIGGDGLRNFRSFLGNLEAAIEQQSGVIAGLTRELDAARASWRRNERRVDSYDTLDERRNTAASRVLQRREQVQQDEMATRTYLKRVTGGD